MKSSTLYSALAILSLASAEYLLPEPANGALATCEYSPVPTPLILDEKQKLQLREADVNPTASAAQTYPPTVTTNWRETTLNGVSTWVAVAYTQTFAKVPDQWPSPGSGAIGYGTLKKMFAQPAELVVGVVMVKQALHVLEVVEVVETRTVVEGPEAATRGNGTGFGTGNLQTGGYGTAAYGTAAYGIGTAAQGSGDSAYATGFRTHSTGPTAFLPSGSSVAAPVRFFG